MAQPLVQFDTIEGNCPGHTIPNPSSGSPQPAGPLPFKAPLDSGLDISVQINDKAAAVVGSSGKNATPHAGLHPSDVYGPPSNQIGNVMSGSPTVFVGGKPIATTDSLVTMCAGVAGKGKSTVSNVKIG